MAKFKCKHTDQVYEYKYDHDIEQMREHDEYEEVFDDEAVVEEKKPAVLKVRGK